jgi:acyl-CoA synthetase (AMP-forming)/AMP-acid ligase II
MTSTAVGQGTLYELLSSEPGGNADDVALTAVGAQSQPLTYRALRASVERTIARLNELGAGRNDRVAIVMDGGPELAVCFLGVAAGCAAAPLNPAYKAAEIEFYLTDLRAKLLIVEGDGKPAAVEAAARLGVPLVHLTATPEEGAGTFRLEPSSPSAARPKGAEPNADEAPHARQRAEPNADEPRGGPAAADDVALVLHTSGTTSRPKMVPLLQRNVCASARNVARSLELTRADRGLEIMPLFHIHGLIAGLLAPLSAGGRVCVSPGFNAFEFFRWFAGARPTWYTAVPTMHQAILLRAGNNRDAIAQNRLRFVRSSSSSLPPQVIEELEATFGAPVIEAYGMTEAAHQMASNPLPPGARKPGTVGPAAGPDVAIMDAEGNLLPQLTKGEIVIRGPNVMSGYENNAKANAEAFAPGGWFRTGDQGTMDGDGYVTIVGRIKEIINRGGEKISPREVDEIMMDHPAVGQVVTFGVPHETLGEDVAAAVVLREGAAATEKELRAHCEARLARFKVPRTIVFLAEIPKGPTGKLQRIGLAEKLGLGRARGAVPSGQ